MSHLRAKSHLMANFFPLLEIQHPNFDDICEAYLFRNEISAIVEYIGFSVEDLLQHSIYQRNAR